MRHSQAEWEAIGQHRQAHTIFVHHTAGDETSNEQIEEEEVAAQHFTGIGYNKTIWPSGEVKQGRPDDIMPAAQLGRNCEGLAICVVGDFSRDLPTPAALKSLQQVLIIECRRLGCGADSIFGHRDVATMLRRPDLATACPGDALYHELVRPGGVRDQVREALAR